MTAVTIDRPAVTAETIRQLEQALIGLRNVDTYDLDGVDASRVDRARSALDLAIRALRPKVTETANV